MGDLYPVYSLRFLTRASPPLLPYRPDPVRNYSLGLLIGLVLGAVAAYVLDATLRSRASAPAAGPAPVAPPAPAAAPEPLALPAAELPRRAQRSASPPAPTWPEASNGTAARAAVVPLILGSTPPANGTTDHPSTPESSPAAAETDSPLDELPPIVARPPRPSFGDLEARLTQLQHRLRNAPAGTRSGDPSEAGKPADV
jgi:hypothetical protein